MPMLLVGFNYKLLWVKGQKAGENNNKKSSSKWWIYYTWQINRRKMFQLQPTASQGLNTYIKRNIKLFRAYLSAKHL